MFTNVCGDLTFSNLSNRNKCLQMMMRYGLIKQETDSEWHWIDQGGDFTDIAIADNDLTSAPLGLTVIPSLHISSHLLLSSIGFLPIISGAISFKINVSTVSGPQDVSPIPNSPDSS